MCCTVWGVCVWMCVWDVCKGCVWMCVWDLFGHAYGICLDVWDVCKGCVWMCVRDVCMGCVRMHVRDGVRMRVCFSKLSLGRTVPRESPYQM